MRSVFNCTAIFFTAIFILMAPVLLNGQVSGNLTDARDGKIYKTVVIGAQTWLAENLVTTHFRNGDPISEATTNDAWDKANALQQPAYCYLNNDRGNETKTGRLYNWYAVHDPRGLAPAGWHIPANDEWQKMLDAIGGKAAAPAKMKAVSGWLIAGGTNESGFTALPSGNHGNANTELFNMFSVNLAYWWSADQYDAKAAWEFFIGASDAAADRHITEKVFGSAVRCVSDKASPVPAKKIVIAKSTGPGFARFTTQYVQTNGAAFQKANFAFEMLNGTLTITNMDNGVRKKYEPLRLYGTEEAGEEGYYEKYGSDLRGDSLAFALSGKPIRLYQLMFDKKGGKLIAVVEAADTDENSLTYYTEYGNSLVNSGNGDGPDSDALAALFLSATSLKDIVAMIESTYTRAPEKNYTGDKEYYSYQFRKNKWWNAMISYSSTGNTPVRVIFFLDKKSNDYIAGKSFLSHFTQTIVDGNTVWQGTKAGLTFRIVPDTLGIILIE